MSSQTVREQEREPAHSQADSDRMTFVEHLEELRRRLLYVVIMLVVGVVACFSLAPQLFELLRVPLEHIPGQKLIVLGPLEMFVTYLKLAVLAAIFITAPWTLLQIWMFISPGLYKHEKRWVLPFVLFGTIFFAAGGAFAWFVVLPLGFKYLVAMVPASIDAQYSVAQYYTFVVRLILAFGTVFELPLAMWILAAAGILRPRTIARFRKYWIVVAFIIGAILTPPDPFTQVLMAVPLLGFFEIGLLGARMLYKEPEPVE